MRNSRTHDHIKPLIGMTSGIMMFTVSTHDSVSSAATAISKRLPSVVKPVCSGGMAGDSNESVRSMPL